MKHRALKTRRSHPPSQSNAGRRKSQQSSITSHPQTASSEELLRQKSLSTSELTSADILHLQRTVGNHAVGSYLRNQVSREGDDSSGQQGRGKGQILLSKQQMFDVFASFMEMLTNRYSSTKSPAEIHEEALIRVAKQIGPVNFERFMEMGLGYFKQHEETEPEPEPEAEEEQESQDPMGDLYAAMRKRANSLNSSAVKISAGIVQAEYLTHMLKSPDDFTKRIAYQIAAGSLGTFAAGKGAVDYAKKKVDVVGQAVEKEVDQAVGKKDKPEPTMEQKGEELVKQQATAVEIMTGQLNTLYQKTRPSYAAYETAYKSFGNARDGFWRANDLETLSQQLGNMISHLKAVQAAANSYLMMCDVLGIRQKAAEYMALDKAVIESLKSSVSDATGMLGGISPGPNLAGKAGDKIKKALGGKVSDKALDTAVEVLEKGVNKVTDVPGKLPKSVVEAQAQQ